MRSRASRCQCGRQAVWWDATHRSRVPRTITTHLGLARDLRGKVGVGQTRAGEDGQLLTTYQRIQTIDGGNARLNELRGVLSCGGVDGGAVDVHRLFGKQGRAAVNGRTHAAEYATKHSLAHGQLDTALCKKDFPIIDIKPLRGEPDKTVFVFANTEDFQVAFAEIIEEVKAKKESEAEQLVMDID